MRFKFYQVAILSILLVASCSKNEVISDVDSSSQNAISFSASSNNAQTKATPINGANLTTTDFDVFAYTADGTAFMGKTDVDFAHDGVKIKYSTDENKWVYDKPEELAYWPTVDNPLDFYAVSPTVSLTGHAAMYYLWNFNYDEQLIYYNVLDEYSTAITDSEMHANHDVMYGIAKAQTKNTNNGTVKFTFKHILSQVVFKARTELSNMKATVRSIKISNVRMSGNFKLPGDAATAATADDWVLSKDLDGNPIGYNNPTVVMDKSIEVTSNETAVDISSTTPLFVIPQTLTKWVVSGATKSKHDADIAKQSYLIINCKLEQNGITLHDGFLYVPFGDSWEPGRRYIYTLIFGGGYDDEGDPILKPIEFDAEVEEWGDVEKELNTSVGGII